MKTIALFGGSFDPLHDGHKAIVKALLKMDEINKVVIMPTFLNPFKSKSHTPATLRLKALDEYFKKFKNVEVSDFEVLQKKKVPTIESVKYLLKKYKKIYLVIGADNLATLDRWQNYDELKKLVTFIVASRDSINIPKEYITLDINVDISSTQLRRKQMQERIENITSVLDKHKAESIEVFDLKDKNYFVDYAIIASSLGSKHTTALLDHLKKEIKPQESFNHVDESGDWVVIDLGDILIHIMTPEYRVKYDMESFLSSLKDGNEGDSF
jgi:nicotinate-nucleotide adenylyltransferase